MPDDGPGDSSPIRYERSCKFVNSLFYPDLERKARADEIEAKKKFAKNKKKFLVAKRRYEKIQKEHSSQSQIYRNEERRFLRYREELEDAKRKLRDADLKKALAISQLDLEPYEVRGFSNAVYVLSLVSVLLLSLPLIILSDFDYLYIMLSLIGLIVIPGLLSVYVDKYPERKARRMRSLIVGKMPQAIHYLSLSMRLTPSLDKAVRYASTSVDEPLASDLQKVLWDVYMREHSSVEEAFIAFAHDWSEWDDDFKRALYMVRSAALENTDEGVNRVLDKATNIITEGTRSKLEEFSTSLKIPSMVLFAIGIMLPLLIAILLPILGLGKEWTWPMVLITNVLLPLLILIYTHHILGSRPELSSPPDISDSISSAKRGLVLFLCILVLALLLSAGILLYEDTIFSSLFVVWAVGSPVALYCYFTNTEARGRGRNVRKMEDEYTEGLFQLGNRIAEGKPFESALRITADTMRNTLIATLFKKISYNLQMTRASLEDVLFGPSGILVNSPARTIRNTMRTVVEASEKDPKTAGKTIILISNYLSELKNVERSLKEKLHEITGMMSQTAVFIAPVVMGVTVILYQLLSANIRSYDIPSDIDVELFGMGQEAISPLVLSISLGIYLLQLVVVVSFFVGRIKYGKDRIELKNTLAHYIFIALIVFTISMIVMYLVGAAYISDLTPASGLAMFT